jgi:hypothetical protein
LIRQRRALAFMLAVTTAALVTTPAVANRDKDDPVEYPIGRDERDYDPGPVSSVRRIACNRELIGAVIGGSVGRRMDRADNGRAYQALEFASPGETVYWRNPESQVEYGITPARRTRDADGRECTRVQNLGHQRRSEREESIRCRLPTFGWPAGDRVTLALENALSAAAPIKRGAESPLPPP